MACKHIQWAWLLSSLYYQSWSTTPHNKNRIEKPMHKQKIALVPFNRTGDWCSFSCFFFVALVFVALVPAGWWESNEEMVINILRTHHWLFVLEQINQSNLITATISDHCYWIQFDRVGINEIAILFMYIYIYHTAYHHTHTHWEKKRARHTHTDGKTILGQFPGASWNSTARNTGTNKIRQGFVKERDIYIYACAGN